VSDGAIERRFARSSAMIDALTSEEWEPVRLRDPRISRALNVYATQPNVFIPQSYWLIAASPVPVVTVPATGGADEETPSTTNPPSTTPPGGTVGGTGTPVTTEQPPPGQSPDQPEQGDQPQQPAVPAGTGQGGAIGRGNNRNQEEDERRDPLERFFQNGNDKLPIVGVATKMKGLSVRGFKGLQNYEEWVFIYIPTQREVERAIQENQNRLGLLGVVPLVVMPEDRVRPGVDDDRLHGRRAHVHADHQLAHRFALSCRSRPTRLTSAGDQTDADVSV